MSLLNAGPADKLLSTQVACGDTHSLALTADGAVYSWGSGYDGRLGHGTISTLLAPTQIEGLKANSVFAGGGSSAAVDTSGKL